MTEEFHASERGPERDIEYLIEKNRTNLKLEREDITGHLEAFGGMEGFLQAFVDAGYLLHGSNNQVEEFEPRQPKKVPGSKPNPGNEQTAVYAGNHPALPILMAVVSRSLMREASGERIKNGLPAVTFGAGEVFYANHPLDSFMRQGYVHVLSRDNFVSSDPSDPNCGQFVSFEAVQPLLIIPVLPEDFTYQIEIRD